MKPEQATAAARGSADAAPRESGRVCARAKIEVSKHEAKLSREKDRQREREREIKIAGRIPQVSS